MTPIEKRETRAAACRVRASESDALAGASTLAHVREKHGLAAARWRELAAMDEKTSVPPPILRRTRAAPSLEPRLADVPA